VRMREQRARSALSCLPCNVSSRKIIILSISAELTVGNRRKKENVSIADVARCRITLTAGNSIIIRAVMNKLH